MRLSPRVLLAALVTAATSLLPTAEAKITNLLKPNANSTLPLGYTTVESNQTSTISCNKLNPLGTYNIHCLIGFNTSADVYESGDLIGGNIATLDGKQIQHHTMKLRSENGPEQELVIPGFLRRYGENGKNDCSILFANLNPSNDPSSVDIYNCEAVVDDFAPKYR